MTPPAARGAPSPATTARTVAQAKINLFLRVLAREVNGYHQIETLFSRLELGDDVVVRTRVRGRSLDCVGDVIPPDGLGPVEWNLAWRAAVAYADATGWPNDFALEIQKRIPVAGGLGGGSSDAAAVLRCLNALAPTPVSRGELLAIAAPLGADVPFLTMEAPLALAWGRGERLLALDPLPSRPVTLVVFPFGVSTRDAYGWLDDARSDAVPVAREVSRNELTSWSGIARLAHNDFASVVAQRFDEIAVTLATLRSVAARGGDETAIVLLAGTGATVFLVADRQDANAADRLRSSGIPSRMVMTRTATHVVGVEVSD